MAHRTESVRRRRTRWWATHPAAREEGFTLVEVMVAGGILFTALTALAYTSTVAFVDIGLARQRQAATGLANQALEQVRALPYEVLVRGLANSDLATADPNILVAGGEYRFEGERIPHADITGPVKPLVPHRSTATVGPTLYTVSVYPTFYGDDMTAGIYRVSVLVDWTTPVRQGVSTQVRTSTLVHTRSTPFPGPRQPFFYGTAASQPGGSIDVAGTLGSITVERAGLVLAERVSNMQVEQTSAVQGLVRTTGVILDVAGSAAQTVGQQQASSAASNDPAGAGPSDTASTSAQATQSLASTDAGSRIEVTASGNDSATTHSTAAASGTECQSLSGAAHLDGLPCGSARGHQGATTTATMRLQAGATDLGTAVLASVAQPAGASPNLGRAFTNRATGPEGSTCATAVADSAGCVATAVSRTMGATKLAGLPSGVTPPLLWEGQLVQLVNWSDRVTAESGTGTSAPSVASSGVIRYWAGDLVGYVNLVVDQLTQAGTVVPAAPLRVVQDAADGPVDIQITSSLTVGGASTADSAPVACAAPCVRTDVEARSRSPLIGTVTYTATQNGVTIADLALAVDLGSLLGKASYTPAPAGA